MVDLVGREPCQAPELAVPMMLLLSTKDAVAVVITIREHDAVSVGVSIQSNHSPASVLVKGCAVKCQLHSRRSGGELSQPGGWAGVEGADSLTPVVDGTAQHAKVHLELINVVRGGRVVAAAALAADAVPLADV